MSTLDQTQYRLPTNVKPIHYDIIIKTDLEKLEFHAYEIITLRVVKETSSIIFNSAKLELANVVLSSDAFQGEIRPMRQSIDEEQQRVTCEFDKSLPQGSQANLKIYFSGKLTGSMRGYYRSSYQLDGQEKFYALTDFEPTAAREAFPCWDEPLLKATFGITLISRDGTVNLSNMNVLSEKNTSELGSELEQDLSTLIGQADGNWKITEFANTPLMSTYIVAFANGHFEYLEDMVQLRERTIPLRIYTTADNIHQAKFALQVKKEVLPIYEKVFDVAFPLPKLDTLVASDFESGAMENWGLITGRTTALLLDPERADLTAKQLVASTQCHEVAHMWFGNIATMEWWTYLYLNEGFATLMGEVIILGEIFPEWKSDSIFISEHLNEALALDAKLSSHPIEVDSPDANQINQIFDSLSYSKAASVLRMLSNHVGEELFLKGVSLYLKNHLYGNSVTKDLWNGIAQSTGQDIVGIMTNWVEKVGFPVLTVTETSNGIKVRQNRFLETGVAEEEDNETIWSVPLSILTVGKDGKPSINTSALLTEREQVFELDTSKPYKLNGGTSGVYRVLYTPEHMSKLANEAAKPEGQGLLGLNDRVGLVQDVMALSKAGLAKLSSALSLLEGLRNETEYVVWSGISESLSNLVSIWWEYPEIIDALDKFRRELFVPLVEKLGYENRPEDTPHIISLRSTAVAQATAAKDPDVLNEIQGRFSHYLKTGNDSTIPADIQSTIYSVTVRHGGKAEYDAVFKIYEQGKTPTGRVAALIALGATQVPELQESTFSLASDKSRDQDVEYFFRGLAENFATRRTLAKYFMEHFDVFHKRFEGNFTISELIETCFQSLSSKRDYEDIKAFFVDKDISKYSLVLEQTLDGIEARAAYIDRSTEDLKSWLRSNGKL